MADLYRKLTVCACRQHLLKGQSIDAGKTVLYFGCRRRNEDYLYGSEFEAFERNQVLNRLDVAFSRASSQKVYVQHRMKDQVGLFASLFALRL